MKKIFFLLVIFGLSLSLFAQNTGNGKINLQFDDIKIMVPIDYVRLQKGNGILITASGKTIKNNNSVNMVLQFSINDLKPQNATAQNFMMNIVYSLSGKNQINFSFRGDSGRYYNIGKQLTFTYVKTNCTIMKAKYEEGRIKFAGKFSGVFSAETGIRATSGKVKIKNGKFEIIF